MCFFSRSGYRPFINPTPSLGNLLLDITLCSISFRCRFVFALLTFSLVEDRTAVDRHDFTDVFYVLDLYHSWNSAQGGLTQNQQQQHFVFVNFRVRVRVSYRV